MITLEIDASPELGVTQNDEPGDGILPWLLALTGEDQDGVASPPAAHDPDVLKLARGMANCVSSGCLNAAAVATVWDLAAHAGRHAGDAGLKDWTKRAFRLAVLEHKSSLQVENVAVSNVTSKTEWIVDDWVTSDGRALCGYCGLWRTRDEFEDAGCCSRRAVERGNRWPGDELRTYPAEPAPNCRECGQTCTRESDLAIVKEYWSCTSCSWFESVTDFPRPTRSAGGSR